MPTGAQNRSPLAEGTAVQRSQRSAQARSLDGSWGPDQMPQAGPEAELGVSDTSVDLGLSIHSAPDIDLPGVGRTLSPLTLVEMLAPGRTTTDSRTAPRALHDDEKEKELQRSTTSLTDPGRHFTTAGLNSQTQHHPPPAGIRFRAYLEQHGLSGLSRSERLAMLRNVSREDATNMLAELLDLVQDDLNDFPSAGVRIASRRLGLDRCTVDGLRRSILPSSFNLSISGLQGALWPRLSTAVKSDFTLPPPAVTTRLEEGEDPAGFQTLNHYTILGEAGRGAHGSVHIATTPDGEFRAIKVVRKETLRKRWRHMIRRTTASTTEGDAEDSLRWDEDRCDPDRMSMSEDEPAVAAKFTAAVNKELEVMKKLRHRNIVHLYEAIDDPEENLLYLVMPYIERGPVVRLSPEGTCEPLDIDVARGYMRQVVDAVRYLHERQIAHRDIKPDNLLLGDCGRVFVSDFGVSQMFDEADELLLDRMVGTPAFMAPECLPETRGDLPASEDAPRKVQGKPVDVWALGVTLYVMLLGRLPFSASTSAELAAAIQRGPLEFIPLTAFSAASRPDYSAAFDLLRRMLRKDPASRITINGCSRHRFLRFASQSDDTSPIVSSRSGSRSR